MGKYYSASTDANAHSFPCCKSNVDVFSRAVCVAIGDLCISESEPEWCRVGKSNADSQASSAVTPAR